MTRPAAISKIEVAARRRGGAGLRLLDAVSKGTLDGGHGVLVYHYGKQTALALWVRVGLRHGRQHAPVVAQVRRGQAAPGEALQVDQRERVSFPYGPMPTQPLGWFKKPITKADDLKG